MNKYLVALLTAAVVFSMSAQDAEAARLGGGGSSGMSRSSSVMNRQAIPPRPAAPTQAAPTAAPAQAGAPVAAPAARSGMSRWLGPIAGLAAGIGLAALFSHLGMGEGLANFAMIAMLAIGAIIVFRLIFRKKQEAQPMQYAADNVPGSVSNQYRAPEPFAPQNTNAGAAYAPVAAANDGAPADFDVEGFVRQAKLNFVRLQAANDAGNMDDIRLFTTPEMFAEVQMQYQERGRSVQQTDVIQLNADLLDVTTEDKRHIASVRFHGQLRETPNAPPAAFSEVWHLVKPMDGSTGWVVAGIQQS